MLSLLIYVLIGGSFGALFEYCNCYRTGTCPLTANWQRGAFYGAVVATLFYSASGSGVDSKTMNQSTANVKHITDAEFDAEVTQAMLPVVADFYATWCGPCRQLAPTMDALADEFAGKIKFVKINVDESPKLAQQFQVEGIPMLLFFKNGQPTERLVGLPSKVDLIMQLNALLQANGHAV